MFMRKCSSALLSKGLLAACGTLIFSALQSLFSIGTVPPATLNGTTVTFPITGGDTSTGMITHSGGLTLTGTTTPMGVGTMVAAEDYVINLNSLVLSGNVSVNGGAPMMGVALFDIGSGDVLTVDSALAGALTSVFGVPNLAGATVGTATVSPITGGGAATPEPASFALVGGGLLAAFQLLRKRRA
jgi:hypothetical protein